MTVTAVEKNTDTLTMALTEQSPSQVITAASSEANTARRASPTPSRRSCARFSRSTDRYSRSVEVS